MKGVIFSELVRWVEEAFSPAVADAMIVGAAVASDGVYTNVGSYPHEEALALIGALSELTQKPVPDLAHSYGYWLSARFVALYPEMFDGYTDAISFLRDVDANHHREVKKLYPDARTPSVVAVVDGQELVVSYASHRPFADVAHGLIRGYIHHFDAALEVVRDETAQGPHAARFVLRPLPADG
ncbi:MAG: heme NO-binding domain-containing protein [Sphingopyxis sp.]|uniref:heme NO-binding domain-containing protein n=1 Tax=Sphingopyxis sp. TaxID=1908224 RepID=UPI002ABB681C|nr:heme NO-binding domain-containing protein [Sphingopyxis sp.]MDZ3830805.1 heme NO-binding domain-containing protein [Sphingopyxis sp.]